MNNLYIHVGPHKTGTTIIQKFLMDNKQALFGQNTVYPKRFQRIFGHHNFRDLVADKALSEDDIAFFNEPHDFLLSSEDCISLEREHWEYLQSMMPNKNIIIVFAWRRASLKLYSIWQETVKHGGTESFFSYYHDHVARPGQSQMLSADLKLNMLSHVFGKHNIRILDYDACARNDDLLQQFCAITDIKWQDDFALPFDNNNARNESMNIADIEIIRALNYRFKASHNLQGAQTRTLYTDNLGKLSDADIEGLKNHVTGHLRELTVGNYFIDNRGEKVMLERFAENIRNYEPHSELKKVKVALDSWLMSPVAQASLHNITTVLADMIEE